MKGFIVEQDKCIGCGACVAIDGKHFDFNDEGLSHVINNDDINEKEALEIVEVCPTGAISYDVIANNDNKNIENQDNCCNDCSNCQ